MKMSDKELQVLAALAGLKKTSPINRTGCHNGHCSSGLIQNNILATACTNGMEVRTVCDRHLSAYKNQTHTKWVEL
jgi:hypothetical protein